MSTDNKKPEPLGKEAMRELVDTSEDFVFAPKHSYSLRKLLSANPNGLTDQQISRALMIPVEQVEAEYQSAMNKIRRILGDQ